METPEQEFTSTLRTTPEDSAFNVALIIITAILFFVVLSFYNFILSVYNYMIGSNPNQIKNHNRVNRLTLYETGGYLLVWTVITIFLYWLFKKMNLLQPKNAVAE